VPAGGFGAVLEQIDQYLTHEIGIDVDCEIVGSTLT
jgi:hypothetical protein